MKGSTHLIFWHKLLKLEFLFFISIMPSVADRKEEIKTEEEGREENQQERCPLMHDNVHSNFCNTGVKCRLHKLVRSYKKRTAFIFVALNNTTFDPCTLLKTKKLWEYCKKKKKNVSNNYTFKSSEHYIFCFQYLRALSWYRGASMVLANMKSLLRFVASNPAYSLQTALSTWLRW